MGDAAAIRVERLIARRAGQNSQQYNGRNPGTSNTLFSEHILFILSTGVSIVEVYIRASLMDSAGTWGTENEILTLAHLLNTPE